MSGRDARPDGDRLAPNWAAPASPPRLRPRSSGGDLRRSISRGLPKELGRRTLLPARDVSPWKWLLTLVTLGDAGWPGGCLRDLPGYGDASMRLVYL